MCEKMKIAFQILKSSFLLVIVILVAGCTSSGGTSLRPISFASSGTSADVLAPLEGGVIGGQIGEELSASQRKVALIAEYKALETVRDQTPVAWGKKGAGTYGEVVAGLPYRVGAQDCRPIIQRVITGTDIKTATGAACRESDGRWVKVG